MGLRGAVRPESTDGAGKFADLISSTWALSLPRGESLDLLAVFLSCCLFCVGGGWHPWLPGIVCLCMNVSGRSWNSPFAKPGLGQAWSPPGSMSSLANLNLRTYRKIPRGLPFLGCWPHLCGLCVHCQDLQGSAVGTNSENKMFHYSCADQ